MDKIIRESIFPSGPRSAAATGWILLAVRIIFGGLLLVHGIQKIMAYDTLCATFPDPIGLGSKYSSQLAIFAEFFCSLGVITGALFRLALIPIIITMWTAAFVTLKGAPWSQVELPVSYLIVFALLFVSGPGRLSLDALVGGRRHSRRE